MKAVGGIYLKIELIGKKIASKRANVPAKLPIDTPIILANPNPKLILFKLTKVLDNKTPEVTKSIKA